MRESNRPPAEQAYPDMEALSALYRQYAERIYTYFQYRCTTPPPLKI